MFISSQMGKQIVIYPYNGRGIKYLYMWKHGWTLKTLFKTDTKKCMIPYIWNVQNTQIRRDGTCISVCVGQLGEGKQGVTVNGYEVFFEGVTKYSKIRLRWFLFNFTNIESHWMMHFRWVGFMAWKFYLIKLLKNKWISKK